MRVVDRFPHEVREIEHLEIPIDDGVHLAARAWIPHDADRTPLPAVLEYLPYRKRDGTRPRDERMHRYFAGHGYVAIRVDLRGTGDSEGQLGDEYTLREQEDGRQVVAWIASQPWCSGSVGMIGKSWGGFNALQIGAMRPPSLKAIIVVCASDDRYTDDAHYMGGCLLNENLRWGSHLLTLLAQPPDPSLVGDRWRDVWLARIRALEFPVETWLRHQRRDEYWKQGSIAEEFDAIECPVLAVGGWADGYTNAVFRLLEGLSAPRRGLVGPWAHLYPHEARPGPAIGFLREALRWWDHWLKGIDTGVMNDPMLRAYIQESTRPTPAHDRREGRFVGVTSWPPVDVAERAFRLDRHALVDADAGVAADADATLQVRSPASTGLLGGTWCSFGERGDDPDDQRADDGKSVVFDGSRLTERLEILGEPVFTAILSSDEPVAQLAVRLNDVDEDGASLLVTYGILNLTHRDGHERPAPLEPGRSYRIEVRLNHCGHAFLPGRRLRLALSTAWWPIAWPSPRPAALTFAPASARLVLPTLPRAAVLLPPLPDPEAARSVALVDLHPDHDHRRVERDVARRTVTIQSNSGVGPDGRPAQYRIDEIDLVLAHAVRERFTIRDDDPASARAVIEHEVERHRGDWSVHVRTVSSMECTPTSFIVRATVEAREGDLTIAERGFHAEIPRDQV